MTYKQTLILLAALATAAVGCAKSERGGAGVPVLLWWQIGGGLSARDAAAIEKIADYTEAKIGVRFEVKQAGWGDAGYKFKTIVNSGEYFDIMFTDLGMYNLLSRMGAYADLSDLLGDCAPALRAYIPESLWKGVTIDGKVFAVPTYKDSSKTVYHVWDHALVEKYGLDISKTSWPDLDTAFRVVKKGEGPRQYPFVLSKGSRARVFDPYDTLASGLEMLGVRADDESRTVINVLKEPAVIEKLRYLHRWYEDGIINPDANVSESNPLYRPFFMEQGWSGVAAGWAAGAGIPRYDVQRAFGPLYSTDTIQGSMNAISASSKYKKECLEFLELVNMDRALRDMLSFGIEGEYFHYTEDGRIHRDITDWPLVNYQLGTYFNLSVTDDNPPDYWDEVRRLNEEAASSVMLGFVMDIEPVRNEILACKAVWDKYVYDLLTGASDPDVMLPRIIAELEGAGFGAVLAEAQRQVNDAGTEN
ncbi:MAG: ABC transporter substrate-binding protein [Treponema sp.]|jgi:putative aldouronate transport system substrate-binding protein|nr:ABC transporter substrate-binding protein [Treponema sp.]